MPAMPNAKALIGSTVRKGALPNAAKIKLNNNAVPNPQPKTPVMSANLSLPLAGVIPR
jgi:hypothetical protein